MADRYLPLTYSQLLTQIFKKMVCQRRTILTFAYFTRHPFIFVKNATIYCIRKLIKGGTTWYMPVEYVNMTKKLKTSVFIGTIF